MPRNSSGVYSLPNPPVVTDTTIDSADENDTRDDLANEITNSLDRGGRGAMTAALKITDGSASSPGLQFSSDANNGWYRNSADNWSGSAGSVEVVNFSTSGMTLLSYRLTPLSPAQITSNQNDYAPPSFSTASMLRLDTDAARDLTGLAGGSAGRVIDIYYVGSTALTLKDEDASSTAANRFALPADLVLGPDMSVRLVYDGTSARWRMATGAVSSAMAPFTMAASLAAAVGLLGLGDLATLDTVGTSQIDADAVTDPKIAASTAQTLTDGANVAWAMASGHVGNWTIGGNRTLDNPSGQKRGRIYILNVTQDGTGGRTITFGSNYVGINGGGVPQPNPAASAVTTYFFFSPDGTKLQLIAPVCPAFGQCILAKSGSDLVLSPRNGNLITINGKVEVIPDAGVTLAVGALSNTTLYYVYAYMSSGTLTLEASATAYATQAGTGVVIKSGDATRTLVGMCYLQSGAFVSSAQKRLVRSWFNEPTIGAAYSSVTGTTSSGSYTEVSTSYRVEALLWAGEFATALMAGYLNSGGSYYSAAKVYIDGAALGNDAYEGYGALYGGCTSAGGSTPGEGYHYWSVYILTGGVNMALNLASLTVNTTRAP